MSDTTAPLLHLPELTLCVVDTRTPALALAALAQSMRQVRYGDVVFFTHAGVEAPPPVRVVPIAPLGSITDYSNFVLRELLPHVQTSHVLLIQWDGYVHDPLAWEPGFLAYDYIGAPWPQFAAPRNVGNGGFSLRSRKLLEALRDPRVRITHPEDICICHDNRELLEAGHGIRFAPPDVAARFSRERLVLAPRSFGFHGVFNFIDTLAPGALRTFAEQLPAAMACSLDTKHLIRQLLQKNRRVYTDIAKILMQKRHAAGLKDGRQTRLWLKLWWQQFKDRLHLVTRTGPP